MRNFFYTMSSSSYEIGTCFFCTKCMYCGKYLTVTTCDCDKSVKPTNKNRTNEVKYHRSCSYILNSDDIYTQKVQESAIKFNYNVFLNTPFDYSLCSSCNGKTYRKRKKINRQESSTADSMESMPSSTTTSIPTTPSIILDLPTPEAEDLLLDPCLLDPSFIASSLSDTTDFISVPLSQEPFKFRLQIKSINDTSSQPSSLIVMETKPSNISQFKERIRDSLDEKYGLVNYGKFKMIYKTENSHGAGNWLDSEYEFNEFLDYCDKLKKTMKMMLVIVNVHLKRKVSL